MPRPLIYKLSTDDNGAPCVQDGILSLAICKQGYRQTAKRGDILYGFMGRRSTDDATEPLVYIAEVTEDPIPIKDYYTNKKYSSRPDRIYKYVNGEYEVRTNAIYHNYLDGHDDRRDKDLGKNRDAQVLLSANFRYLGDKRIVIDPNKYPELTKLVHSLTQTYRPPSNIVSQQMSIEAKDLCNEIWLTYKDMQIGKAKNRPDKRGCDRGSQIICITDSGIRMGLQFRP